MGSEIAQGAVDFLDCRNLSAHSSTAMLEF